MSIIIIMYGRKKTKLYFRRNEYLLRGYVDR